MLQLKKATLNDWQTIAKIEKVARGKLYSTGLNENDILHYLQEETIYLAYHNEVLVGKISFTSKENSITISGLIILPQFRGKGYGKYLSESIIELFPDCAKFTLTVHPENIHALNIYQNLGFIIIEKKENYFGDGEPRLIMELIRVKN
jgi:ribosomal protein S18 acetylase RimI-like enzyme